MTGGVFWTGTAWRNETETDRKTPAKPALLRALRNWALCGPISVDSCCETRKRRPTLFSCGGEVPDWLPRVTRSVARRGVLPELAHGAAARIAGPPRFRRTEWIRCMRRTRSTAVLFWRCSGAPDEPAMIPEVIEGALVDFGVLAPSSPNAAQGISKEREPGA